MSLQLQAVGPNKEELQEVTVKVIGTVEYQAGREYPWLGCHGSVCSYFATKSQAVEYARTGELP